MGVGGPHLVPDGVVLALLGIVLVKVDDVDGGLRKLLLLLLADAVLLQHTLPFFGEARVLARLIVDADVRDVHGVGGRGNGGAARGTQHAVDKGRKSTFFLATVRAALLGQLAVVAIAIARALGGRDRGFHFAGERVERDGLAQGGSFELGDVVGGVGVCGAGGPTGLGGLRGVEGLLDQGGVEGLAYGGRGQVVSRVGLV